MHTKITLPSVYGNLEFFHFQHGTQEGVVAMNRQYEPPPLVRIHSSCLFSEAFRTLDCDCALQLDASLQYVKQHGGIVVYLYQEGRGVGLKEKVKAISLQQAQGIDTAAAFAALGHQVDPRTYEAAIAVLRDLGIQRIALATANPQKVEALEAAGITVEKRISLSIEKTEKVAEYCISKVKVLGHHGDN